MAKGPKPTVPIVRFLRFCAPQANGCILWLGGKSIGGYGKFRVGGGGSPTLMAHRFIWEQVNGPVPEGLQLDHLCRVPACVNPDHLEPVTPRINTLRSQSITALNAQKTHCHRGHAFIPENTYVTHDGKRKCRTCHKIGYPSVVASRATTCKNGHPLVGEYRMGRWRRCLVCQEERRARRVRRTTCRRGHPFPDERHICLICRNEYKRARRRAGRKG